jgi:hypothetical protein
MAREAGYSEDTKQMGSLLQCALQDGGAYASSRDLIAEPGEAFLPSEHRQDVKYPG